MFKEEPQKILMNSGVDFLWNGREYTIRNQEFENLLKYIGMYTMERLDDLALIEEGIGEVVSLEDVENVLLR